MYLFPCGCQFETLGPSPYPGDPLPLIKIDLNNLPSCPLVWTMLARGLTAGVFQLESNLGKTWTKKLGPKSIEHLNALLALLRPGSLDSLDAEGISTTERYVRRAKGEPIPSVHPVVDACLSKTYGACIFQEQIMDLVGKVAGFDAGMRDTIRKNVGKKDMAALMDTGRKFLEGVEKAGVIPLELGKTLWEIIKAAGRYSFNRSHSVSYAHITYQTSYIKAHAPVLFYTSWLSHAREKNAKWHEEVAKLISEAKLFGIQVNRPSFHSLEPHAWTNGWEITLGICEAKGVGLKGWEVARKKLASLEEQLGSAKEWPWYKILYHSTQFMTAGVMRRLIEVGAFPSDEEVPRRRKLVEYETIRSLKAAELRLLQAVAIERNYPPFGPLLEELSHCDGGIAADEERARALRGKASLLCRPPAPLVDSPLFIANWEKDGLGDNISCMRLDAYDHSNVTHTVKEILEGYHGVAQIGVEIQRHKEVRTKKGKSAGELMCFVTVKDMSGEMDVVIFSDTYAAYKSLIHPQNNVLIRGQKDQSRDGMIAERILQLS